MNKKLKILVCDTTYSPSVNRVAMILRIKYWQKRGSLVSILCSDEAKLFYSKNVKNINYYTFSFHWRAKEYYSAIWYGQILSLALIPLPLTWVVSDMLVFQKQKLPQIFTSTLPHLIKLFLFLLVIPHFGIVGLIVIILIDRYFEPVLPLYFLYKHSGNK